MTKYKYQESFAEELAESWLNGNRSHVRTTIRGLKNKAQAAYIATFIALWLQENGHNSLVFLSFIHPNNQ
jgi:hypothetical protein